MTLATPPSSIHMDLLVGEPVKKREKSDPIEFDALIPKMIRMIPTANKAIPIAFIMFSFRGDPRRRWPALDAAHSAFVIV
jgi:hypothetical protein